MELDNIPFDTLVFLACWKCSSYPRDNSDTALQRCGGCKRVMYCSSECQKEDWTDHKRFCKAFAGMEKDPWDTALLLMGMSDVDREFYQTKIEMTNFKGLSQSIIKAAVVRRKLRPPQDFKDHELSLVNFEPRCLDCARSPQEVRMENATIPAGNHPSRSFRACQICGRSFYCCEDHFSAARHSHSEIPYEDGQNNKSQCQINLEIGLDSFVTRHVKSTIYMYGSLSVKSEWNPLQGLTLETDFFQESLVNSNGEVSDNELGRALFRRDTDTLTLPLTILFALEKMSAGDNSWTQKNVLTIHFIGADRNEFKRYRALHDIFHRLPNLHEIRCVLCGPNLVHLPPDIDIVAFHERTVRIMECSFCDVRQNKVVPTIVAQTYHDFVRAQGPNYTQPDLAVAFNSGCGVGLETQSVPYQLLDMAAHLGTTWSNHDEGSTPWRETEQLLVQKNIPTIFTATNADDALKDEQRLLAAGAKFVPGLERQRNPWGSLLTLPRPGLVRGFQSYNRWIAGGFK